jgi:hypothetical protein
MRIVKCSAACANPPKYEIMRKVSTALSRVPSREHGDERAAAARHHDTGNEERVIGRRERELEEREGAIRAREAELEERAAVAYI